MSESLNTPGVRVLLNTDFNDIREELGRARLIYTGAIDEFFGHSFGALPYRSLRFDFQSLREPAAQPVGQVNYPGTGAYTRVTEFKHLTGQRSDSTTVAYEYPIEHIPGRNEPFYPVPRPENRALYERYCSEARTTCPAARFAGRLGDYRYYNMDQAVARALTLFRHIAVEQKLAA